MKDFLGASYLIDSSNFNRPRSTPLNNVQRVGNAQHLGKPQAVTQGDAVANISVFSISISSFYVTQYSWKGNTVDPGNRNTHGIGEFYSIIKNISITENICIIAP